MEEHKSPEGEINLMDEDADSNGAAAPAAAGLSGRRARFDELVADEDTPADEDDADGHTDNTEENKMRDIQRQNKIQRQRERRQLAASSAGDAGAAAAAGAGGGAPHATAAQPAPPSATDREKQKALYEKRVRQFDGFTTNNAYQFDIDTSPAKRESYGKDAKVFCLACKSYYAVGESTGNWITHIGQSK